MINTMDSEQIKELLNRAIAVRENAYAKYSNFAVGAALLCGDGEIIVGCNVENAVYGLAICAERVAMTQAVAKGQMNFEAIAIAANPLAPPCGTCRQFMAEFNPNLTIISCDSASPEKQNTWRLAELLPEQFKL